MHHVHQSNLVHPCEPKLEINKNLEIKLISVENKAQVIFLEGNTKLEIKPISVENKAQVLFFEGNTLHQQSYRSLEMFISSIHI